MNTKLNNKDHFSAELSSVLLARRPVGVVLFTKTEKTCKKMKITLQKRKKMTKKRPSGIVGAFSLFQGIPVFLKTTFYGKQTQF